MKACKVCVAGDLCSHRKVGPFRNLSPPPFDALAILLCGLPDAMVVSVSQKTVRNSPFTKFAPSGSKWMKSKAWIPFGSNLTETYRDKEQYGQDALGRLHKGFLKLSLDWGSLQVSMVYASLRVDKRPPIHHHGAAESRFLPLSQAPKTLSDVPLTG